MALFKIHKGDSANLDAQSRVEGYCWFTPDTGHFFIDTADARVPINATMYGVCNTAAATATKTVDITGFRLYTGARVTVKFTYASGVANSTLNVNGTGAKNMVRYGTTAIGNSSTLGWAAGAIQTFTYDGTSWVADYWHNTTYSNVALGQGYATCSTAAATAAKTASLSSYSLTKGGIVAVKFTYAVPANATLNINSKGAKNMYYRGAKIVAGIINAGDIAIFMYDGTQYQFLAKDYNNATTTTAGLMSATDKAKLDGIASGATANTGDITEVTAGNGLTGGGSSGSVTLNVGEGTGITVAADTVSAKLRSTTALTIDSAAATTTTGRVYPVAVDKTGYLSVNVPWTDNNTDTKVTQTVTTSNAAYPLLLAPNGQTATTTTTSYFDSGVTLNPSTNTITANISGNAAQLTSITETDKASSSDTWRRIWMGWSNNTTGRPAYDDRFVIQTSTGTLKAPNFLGNLDGTATALATGRTLKVNLASTSASTAFTGAANVHDIGVAGTLPVGNGGTGQTSAANAANAFMNALSTGSSTPTDADYYICQYAGGGSTTTTYHRRPTSALWTYMKGKMNTDGNAATATKLKNAFTLSLAGAADDSVTIDGSANKTLTIADVKESYLSWGGQNIDGGISPVGAALSTEHSANRLAYFNPAGVTVETSNDGGATWTTASTYAAVKIKFVTTSAPITIGTASTVTTNHRTRITFAAQDGTNGYMYTRPRKLLVDVSTPHGLSVTLEVKKGTSGATWETLGTYPLSGWSGWNDIPLNIANLGGGTSQTGNYWYLRLTYANTSVNSNYKTTLSTVRAIRLFGDTCWTRTSNMGETGHLYSYDENQNATFPAKVTATSFSGSGASLTTLNASNISSGTIAAARLPTASSTLGGVKTTSAVTSTSGLTACPIINGVVYYKDTNTQAVTSVNGLTGAVKLKFVYGNADYTLRLNDNATDRTGALAVKDANDKNVWILTNTTTAGVLQYQWYNSSGAWVNQANLLHTKNYTDYCAKASHTHSYLPLAGGTVTGEVTSSANVTASNAAFRNIKAVPSTTEIVAGTTAIPTGEIWVRYE